jgi:hypothetical protein
MGGGAGARVWVRASVQVQQVRMRASVRVWARATSVARACGCERGHGNVGASMGTGVWVRARARACGCERVHGRASVSAGAGV